MNRDNQLSVPTVIVINIRTHAADDGGLVLNNSRPQRLRPLRHHALCTSCVCVRASVYKSPSMPMTKSLFPSALSKSLSTRKNVYLFKYYNYLIYNVKTAAMQSLIRLVSFIPKKYYSTFFIVSKQVAGNHKITVANKNRSFEHCEH